MLDRSYENYCPFFRRIYDQPEFVEIERVDVSPRLEPAGGAVRVQVERAVAAVVAAAAAAVQVAVQLAAAVVVAADLLALLVVLLLAATLAIQRYQLQWTLLKLK